MDLEHALTLAQARSFVAALADAAVEDDASAAFERALIELDWLHGDESPGLDTIGLGEAMETLDASKGALDRSSNGDDLAALLQVAPLHPDAATSDSRRRLSAGRRFPMWRASMRSLVPLVAGLALATPALARPA